MIIILFFFCFVFSASSSSSSTTTTSSWYYYYYYYNFTNFILLVRLFYHTTPSICQNNLEGQKCPTVPTVDTPAAPSSVALGNSRDRPACDDAGAQRSSCSTDSHGCHRPCGDVGSICCPGVAFVDHHQ
uniref:Secreted peptide n=1 Tax=Anopheles braziliensis TaxID=58242 RepID=A0A2M3ZMA6_9DIPT